MPDVDLVHSDNVSLAAALAWLEQVQDALGSGAFPAAANGAGCVTPSTAATAVLIPTLYAAAARCDRPDLTARAERAALWTTHSQTASGGMRGGPARTGEALRGWLCAFAETGCGVFAGAARRAGRFLVATLDDDGLWRHRIRSQAGTAWALAAASRPLNAPEFRVAGARHLRAIAQHRVHEGATGSALGPDTLRGVLEGACVLEDEHLVAWAASEADAAAESLDARGARGDGDLLACAQLAVVWLRLWQVTGARPWLEPARCVLGYLESVQTGGIPETADGPARVSSRATQLFIDALLLAEALTTPRGGAA